MSRVQARMSATSRVLTLLALLAGLLAMHGLAGAAHAAHAAAAPVVHTAADMADDTSMTSSGNPALARLTEPPVSGDVSLPARHGGAVMSAMVLCLVALFAVGAALLAPALRSQSPRRTASPRLTRLRVSPTPRGPPPDLLSQLCVLRT